MRHKAFSISFALLTGTILLPVSWAAQNGDNGSGTAATEKSPENDKVESENKPKSEQDEQREKINSLQRDLNWSIKQGELKAADETIKQLQDNSSFPKLLLQRSRVQLLQKLVDDPSGQLNKIGTAKAYLEQTIAESLTTAGNPLSLQELSQIATKLISDKDGSEAAATYLKSQISKVEASQNSQDPIVISIASGLRLTLINPSLNLINADDASRICEEEISKLTKVIPREPNSAVVSTFLKFWDLKKGKTETDEKDRFKQTVEQLRDELLAGEIDENKLRAATYLVISLSNSLRNDNPREALELLAKTTESLETKKESAPALEKAINSVISNLKQVSASLATSLKQAEMIGKSAPALDAEYWVNGEGSTLESLKGKVVLVDFWAVWCGPCIATFPELRQLHEDFSDKGLALIGVTRQYNYVWDEDKKAPTRSDSDEVPVEEELNMLTKFIQSYSLPHPTMVIPKGSTVFADYAILDIPHVALIDKKGNIALVVQVRSGARAAKQIHKKIVELIAE